MALRMCVRFSRVAPRLLWDSNVLHRALVPSSRIHLAGLVNTKGLDTSECPVMCRQQGTVQEMLNVRVKTILTCVNVRTLRPTATKIHVHISTHAHIELRKYLVS